MTKPRKPAKSKPTTAKPAPASQAPARCAALNSRRRPCGFNAEPGREHCSIHAPGESA